MTADERADALRALCMGLMQREIDACPPGFSDKVFGAARWEFGALVWPDLAIMKGPPVGEEGWRAYDYQPGFDGKPGTLFGLPVNVVEGDGVSLIVGAAVR